MLDLLTLTIIFVQLLLILYTEHMDPSAEAIVTINGYLISESGYTRVSKCDELNAEVINIIHLIRFKYKSPCR